MFRIFQALALWTQASSLPGLPSTTNIHIGVPTNTVQVFGVPLLGVNPETGKKLFFSIVLILGVALLGAALRWLARVTIWGWKYKQLVFWTQQGIRLLTALVLIVGLVSIWFSTAPQLATFFGLVAAGVAFALQRVITAVAGYFVILRGKTFNVGDRIVMGGVRGDVIDLGFIQTRVMEMGEPPSVQASDPAMWVRARQYTGRIVSITNDKIFDTPVYNYTKEFPYIWEELHFPITYKADRARAEEILLEAARRHSVRTSELSEPALKEMERRYVMRRSEIKPHVFWRLTDNWLELAVRFVTLDHATREVKNAMSREILAEFDKAGIGIASSTYDIVGFPPVIVKSQNQTPG